MAAAENTRLWLLAAGAGVLFLFWPRGVQARGGSAPLLGPNGRGRVSSPFGPRTSRKDGVTRQHNGIDLPAPIGTEVRAAANGVIVDAAPDGRRSGYGNVLLLEHPDGSVTLYAHLNRFARGIKTGTRVRGGDLIGYVGATQLPRPPMVSKPHLHFEWLVEAPRTASGRIIVHSKAPRRFEPEARLRRYNRALA